MLRYTQSDPTFFFTLRLQDRSSDLFVRRIDLLRDVTRLAMARWPFEIPAAVILPHTLHMIWALPTDDPDYTKRWRLIKSTFSRHVPAGPGEGKGVWQRRFWDHRIKDQADLDLHMHLITTAPVTAGLVKTPLDWPYSSLHHVKTTDPVRSALDPSIVVNATQMAPIRANESW